MKGAAHRYISGKALCERGEGFCSKGSVGKKLRRGGGKNARAICADGGIKVGSKSKQGRSSFPVVRERRRLGWRGIRCFMRSE